MAGYNSNKNHREELSSYVQQTLRQGVRFSEQPLDNGEWHVTAQVGPLSESSRARNKKEGRNIAAHKMYVRLRDIELNDRETFKVISNNMVKKQHQAPSYENAEIAKVEASQNDVPRTTDFLVKKVKLNDQQSLPALP